MIRDRSLGRGWTGRYVFGDSATARCGCHTCAARPPATHPTRLKVNQLVSFGEDGRGRVYAVSLNGPVYRIGAADP